MTENVESSSGIERGSDYWDNHCSRCSDELAEGRDATLCKECSREIEMKRRECGDRCERCDGHGYIYGTICDLQRAMNGRDTLCPVCHGSGRVPYEPEDDERLVPDGGQVEAEVWCSSCGETAEGNDRDGKRFAETHTVEDCPAGEPAIRGLGKTRDDEVAPYCGRCGYHWTDNPNDAIGKCPTCGTKTSLLPVRNDRTVSPDTTQSGEETQ